MVKTVFNAIETHVHVVVYCDHASVDLESIDA